MLLGIEAGGPVDEEEEGEGEEEGREGQGQGGEGEGGGGGGGGGGGEGEGDGEGEGKGEVGGHGAGPGLTAHEPAKVEQLLRGASCVVGLHPDQADNTLQAPLLFISTLK